MITRHKSILSVLAAVIVLAGCASYDGRGLKPGQASEADVRNLMGTPAGAWLEPDGGSLLTYPHGPMGLHTYVVRIDGNGRLVSIEEVLNEEHFARLNRGMGGEDVNRLLGPPYRTVPFARRNEIAWDYRYVDTWGYTSILSVIFDGNGKVKTTVRTREETGSRPSSSGH